jgi:hypothetical protein
MNEWLRYWKFFNFSFSFGQDFVHFWILVVNGANSLNLNDISNKKIESRRLWIRGSVLVLNEWVAAILKILNFSFSFGQDFVHFCNSVMKEIQQNSLNLNDISNKKIESRRLWIRGTFAIKLNEWLHYLKFLILVSVLVRILLIFAFQPGTKLSKTL